MKLFIWQGAGVLEDYGSGMIVVLAPDLAAAYRAGDRTLAGSDDMRTVTPEVVDLPGCAPKRPRVWHVYGGG